MKYARKASQKLKQQIVDIADDLLEKNIDLAAAVNHPIDIVRGKEVVSGRRLARYISQSQPMQSAGTTGEEEGLYMSMSSMSRTITEGSTVDPEMTTIVEDQDQPGASGGHDTVGRQSDMTSDGHSLGNVRFKDGLPQFKEPSDRLSYVLDRYLAVGFPLPREELRQLECLDDIFWCLGCLRFEDVANNPALCTDACPDQVEPQTRPQSTPINTESVPKTPHHDGHGISNIPPPGAHSTFTNVGSRVKFLDKSNRISDSSASAAWDDYGGLVGASSLLPRERDYTPSTPDLKTPFAQALLRQRDLDAVSRSINQSTPTESARAEIRPGDTVKLVANLIANTSKLNSQLEGYINSSTYLDYPSRGVRVARDYIQVASDVIDEARVDPDVTREEIRALVEEVNQLHDSIQRVEVLSRVDPNIDPNLISSRGIRETPKRKPADSQRKRYFSKGNPGGGGPSNSDSDSDKENRGPGDQRNHRDDGNQGNGNHRNQGNGNQGPNNGNGGGGGDPGDSGDDPDDDPNNRNHGGGGGNFRQDVANILANINRSQRRSEANQERIANALRDIPGRRAGIDGTQYQNALKTLRFFSGRAADDLTGCPTAARNQIEPDCDRWVASWRRMCASFNLDEESSRNAFFDRLAGDALEHLLDYRTSAHDMQFRIDFLRLRFAIVKSFEDICKELNQFQRLPFESLNVCVIRLERICTEYMSVSRECSLELKQILIWNKFVTLVPHPRLAEKFEAHEFNSRNLQEAVRLAQQHYNRYNLAPWSTKSLENEKKDDKNSVKKSNSITTQNQKKTKPIACYSCGGPHRAADCIVGTNSKDLKNIKSGGSASGGASGTTSGGSTGYTQPQGSRPAQKAGSEHLRQRYTCYWCSSPEHKSRDCPIAGKFNKWLEDKKKKSKPGGNRPENRPRGVNQVSLEENQTAEFAVSPTGEDGEDPVEDQGN